jgi:hypothetical protein
MGRSCAFTSRGLALRQVAHKRFSKLLHKRVANAMKVVLGDDGWAQFALDALAFGKPLYMAAFTPGNVWCRGPISGGGCPHAMGPGAVQPPEPGSIHGDHTIDLNNICTAWSAAHTTGAAHWHTGLRADVIISAIFEFTEAHLVFRCDKCHSHLPHYATAISKADLALPGSRANPIVIAE